MNIRLNEEVASKLNGVADGGRIGGTGESTIGSEANELVHRTPPERVRLERKSMVLLCSRIGRNCGTSASFLIELTEQVN